MSSSVPGCPLHGFLSISLSRLLAHFDSDLHGLLPSIC